MPPPVCRMLSYLASRAPSIDASRSQNVVETEERFVIIVAPVVRLMKTSPVALVVFLGALVLAAVLIALQGVTSPTWGFLALIVGGLAVGLCGAQLRDTVVTAFVMGFVAYFSGTVAFVTGASVQTGYSAERATAEVAIGAFVGLLFGVIAGLWTAGGRAIGAILRGRVAGGLPPAA